MLKRKTIYPPEIFKLQADAVPAAEAPAAALDSDDAAALEAMMSVISRKPFEALDVFVFFFQKGR